MGRNAGGQRVGRCQPGCGLLAHQAALVQYQDALANGTDLGQDMAAEQHRSLALETLDQLADFNDLVGIQTAGRFVQNENFGITDQSLGQAYALAVTMGQVAHQFAAHIVQARAVDEVIQVGLLAARWHFLDFSHEIQVRLDPLVGVQGHVLWHEADAPAHGNGVGHDIVASDMGRTAAGGQRTGQDFHGGGFAGPVGAQEADNFALRDLKTEALQGECRTVATCQSIDFDHRLFVPDWLIVITV